MKYEMFTKRLVFFIWWAAGMLHIVCILGLYLTCGTWHNWVTQNCTQGFAGPCTRLHRDCFSSLVLCLDLSHSRPDCVIHNAAGMAAAAYDLSQRFPAAATTNSNADCVISWPYCVLAPGRAAPRRAAPLPNDVWYTTNLRRLN